MALRKNTNPSPVQLHPDFLELLVRNGMRANIVAGEDNKPRLMVQGHDSPVLTYGLTSDQIKRLSDWGSNYANKSAYTTFTALVEKDFDLPKDLVHARNANGRVTMGLHGYRIGAGEYGRPEYSVPPRGFWGRMSGWLGWTPRNQEGFHLRRIGGELHRGAPMVPDRPDGRMKPGELQSGGYGFYYKGTPTEEHRGEDVDPLTELKAALAPVKAVATEPAKPYKELVTSPVYFTSEKFWECLASHGMVIDVESRTLSVQPEKAELALKYDLTDQQLAAITSNSLKKVGLEERLEVINGLLMDDYDGRVTMEMLNSTQRVNLTLKPEVRLSEDMNPAAGEEIAENEKLRDRVPLSADRQEMTVKADGKVLSILSEMKGRHWEQDVKGGRDVVLTNVVAYENEGKHYLRAEVNGETYTRPITAEQFKELHYRTDEKRIAIVDELLGGISLKSGDYKGEAVNASGTDASRLAAIKETKGWFREGKDGREIQVGRIGVQALESGKYTLSGEVDGEVIAREISKKEYDKFLAMDDYHRMRLFSKLFEEVDMKERLGVGSRITAALAAGLTVMGELSYGQEPGAGYHRPHGMGQPVRAYFKPGVDTPEEVAMRNYEAAVNTENIQNGLRK